VTADFLGEAKEKKEWHVIDEDGCIGSSCGGIPVRTTIIRHPGSEGQL
jgi:hypothetical protein